MTVFPIEPRHRVSYPKRRNSLIIKKQRKIVKKTRLNVLSCNFNCKSTIVRAVCSLIFFHITVLPIGGWKKPEFRQGYLNPSPD